MSRLNEYLEVAAVNKSLVFLANNAKGNSLHNQIQDFIKKAREAGHEKSAIINTIKTVWGLEQGEALDEYHY